MDFGKLNNVNKIDFTLPADATQNKIILEKYKNNLDNFDGNANEFPKIYVGCPVWSNKEWRNKIYPSNAKTEDFLKYYATQFNSIELNTTHYNLGDEATIQKWKNFANNKNNNNFKFAQNSHNPFLTKKYC